MTIQKKLIATLKSILGNKREQIIGIVNLLETEEQQKQMMIYLANNYQNKELMKVGELLDKAEKIAGK